MAFNPLIESMRGLFQESYQCEDDLLKVIDDHLRPFLEAGASVRTCFAIPERGEPWQYYPLPPGLYVVACLKNYDLTLAEAMKVKP
jgi:hypothetical protein